MIGCSGDCGCRGRSLAIDCRSYPACLNCQQFATVGERLGLNNNDCFYCATGERHPVVSIDDEVTAKATFEKYVEDRWEAQGLLTLYFINGLSS